MDPRFWQDKRVLVTGHTGFKGGWLALWLQKMGARVYGYALEPPTQPNLFTLARVRECLAGHTIADIRDSAALTAALQGISPEVIFHLAAQPLVRRSYQQPVETYTVNVLGAVNLLEAVRVTPGVRAVVMVTTDKCYAEPSGPRAFSEDAPLGGNDPYSSSKACVEILTAAWRRSFLESLPVPVATARAGNVIGGGDWAADRLLPDILRSLDRGEPLKVRYPGAVRPWQHVLEPLSAYLLLAERLAGAGAQFARAWNFGPDENNARSVEWVVKQVLAAFPGAAWDRESAPQPSESAYLMLDSRQARELLGWAPRWDLSAALRRTVEWHTAWRQGRAMRDVCLEQIDQYCGTAPL